MSDRVLPFDGIHNFRDYGDYPVAGGGRLKRGLLYRSAQHRDATPADLDRVAALDLAVVVDLRGPSERHAAPCPRPEGFAARIIKVEGDTSGLAPHIEAARLANRPGGVRAAMIEGYTRMPFRPMLVSVMRDYFAALAEADGVSLIHCMAGKDRTGLAVALLQTMLGVHRDDVTADYLLTNVAGRAEERIAAGAKMVRGSGSYGALDEESVRVLMMVDAAYLDAAFAGIDERHGSLDVYLRDVLGIDAARREAIRARLVDA